MNIGIGTAQFGLDYGVSNLYGKTAPHEVVRILSFAEENSISVLDTAALYGTSEQVIGESLHGSNAFKIVTKTSSFKKSKVNVEDAIHLRNTFAESLRKLSRPKVYGLLIHHVDDLLADGGQYLMDAMLELKAQGKVAKVGVSIYNSQQIDQVLEKFDIDLVQLPINVFDQRLIQDNKLSLLKSHGIEVHARSIFLQGLLLMQLHDINDYFAPLKSHVIRYQQYLKAKHLSLLQGALAFVLMRKELDQVILGVCSQKELGEILDAVRSLPCGQFDFSDFAVQDECMINPALWKLT